LHFKTKLYYSQYASNVCPASTLENLDKMSRSFLWGSTAEKRKLHLVAWDRVCLPKDEGGLGIRSAKQMNMALLSKVGWRLIHEKASLWAKILSGKYRVGDLHDQSWMGPRRNGSSSWRSIWKGLQSVVYPGLGWVVGDGRDICFWTDKWVSNSTLAEAAVCEVPAGLVGTKIRELWTNGRG